MSSRTTKPNARLLRNFESGARTKPPFFPNSVPTNSVLEGKNGVRYRLNWVPTDRALKANGINISYMTARSTKRVKLGWIDVRVGRKDKDLTKILLAFLFAFVLLSFRGVYQSVQRFTNQSVEETMVQVQNATEWIHTEMYPHITDEQMQVYAQWGVRALWIVASYAKEFPSLSRADTKKWLALAFQVAWSTPSPSSLSLPATKQRRQMARGLQKTAEVATGVLIHQLVLNNIELFVKGFRVEVPSAVKTHMATLYKKLVET
eukprot:609989-Pyramimonas_sp.AAC.1